MSQGFCHGLVSVTMFPRETDLSVDIVVARYMICTMANSRAFMMKQPRPFLSVARLPPPAPPRRPAPPRHGGAAAAVASAAAAAARRWNPRDPGRPKKLSIRESLKASGLSFLAMFHQLYFME